INDAGWVNTSIDARNTYLWDEKFDVATNPDWNTLYTQIFYSNVVLEGLVAYENKMTSEATELKGAALFYRGFAFFGLAQIFTLPYQP
ncbi:RagB/SusD family nutrient uptake outer membrane protein, partial [Klebsiella pneumoniae]